MSERYPYPNAEHYVFPKSRAATLGDEMAFYPEPEELRHMTVALAQFYENTPIMGTMKKHAFLMNVVHHAMNGEGDESRMDSDFLMGTLYGVHTTVHTAPSWVRRWVLGYNPLREITGDDDDLHIRKELLEYLQAWETAGFEEKFEEAPDDLQEALLDFTRQMYGGIYRSEDKQRSFMTGYVFAINLIDSNVPPHRAGAPI